MKNSIFTLALITFFAHGYSFAQSKSGDGYQQSVTNQPGKEFPQVNPERKVRAQILAPTMPLMSVWISEVSNMK